MSQSWPGEIAGAKSEAEVMRGGLVHGHRRPHGRRRSATQSVAGGRAGECGVGSGHHGDADTSWSTGQRAPTPLCCARWRRELPGTYAPGRQVRAHFPFLVFPLFCIGHTSSHHEVLLRHSPGSQPHTHSTVVPTAPAPWPPTASCSSAVRRWPRRPVRRVRRRPQAWAPRPLAAWEASAWPRRPR